MPYVYRTYNAGRLHVLFYFIFIYIELAGVHFVDFSKGFDAIDHDLPLRKLAVYELSSNTLHLLFPR